MTTPSTTTPPSGPGAPSQASPQSSSTPTISINNSTIINSAIGAGALARPLSTPPAAVSPPPFSPPAAPPGPRPLPTCFSTRARNAFYSRITAPNYVNVFRYPPEDVERMIEFLRGSLDLKRDQYNQLQKHDITLRKRARQDYELRGNELWRKAKHGKAQAALRYLRHEEVFDTVVKEHLDSGHNGRDKVFENVKERYWGVSREEVLWIVQACSTCDKDRGPRISAPLQPIIVTRTLERIQIDLIDMRNQSSGKYKWILHVRDHWSKHCVLYALKDKKASTVAKKLELWIRHFGIPLIVQADNGREFAGVVYILLMSLAVKIIHGNPRSPQTQGLIERGNAEVEKKIRKLYHDLGNPVLWHEHLTRITLQLNDAISAAIDERPNRVMFRRYMPLNPDLWLSFEERQRVVLTDESGNVISLGEAFKHEDSLPDFVPELHRLHR
jgi:transposase InsO family protein